MRALAVYLDFDSLVRLTVDKHVQEWNNTVGLILFVSSMVFKWSVKF